MIRGERIDACFDISEVLPPKSAHVREESFPARSSRVGMGAGPRASFLARPPRDPGHGEAVTQIPGDARELARAIGGARGEAGEGRFMLFLAQEDGRASAQPPPTFAHLAKHRQSISASR